MKKIILSIIIGFLFLIGAYWGANKIAESKKSFKPKVKKTIKTVFAEEAVNKTIPIIIHASGNLRAKLRLELYSEVQGVFITGTKLFKTGQSYKKGESIIRINASEYAANVQSAKSNFYNQLTSIMPDMRLDYPTIFPKWEKYLRAFDIEKTTPTFPGMDSEKEKFFISGRGILTSYYNVKNLEQRLSKYRISAPFNGVLIDALVTEGTLVRSGQKLGEFINTDVYELEVAISKKYSDLLKIGEQVVLTNLEKTKSYNGKIVRVNASVDQASQTIKAFIEVKDKSLSEGMYLEAYLNAKEEKEAIEINRNLLIDGDNIYIIKDSVLDVIQVKPIHFSNKKVILKQVPDGVIIVTKPIVGAYAGMPVKIFKEKG